MFAPHDANHAGLNESPSEKEGKCRGKIFTGSISDYGLNESPSEKEGKSDVLSPGA